jgi:CRISPR-associated protein Cas2
MSLDDVHRFVIAYDVGDDLRRSHIATLLEAHGDRAQYSLFLVDIKPARLITLKMRLRSLMEPDDSMLICNLGPRRRGATRIEFIGAQRPITSTGPLVY